LIEFFIVDIKESTLLHRPSKQTHCFITSTALRWVLSPSLACATEVTCGESRTPASDSPVASSQFITTAVSVFQSRAAWLIRHEHVQGPCSSPCRGYKNLLAFNSGIQLRAFRAQISLPCSDLAGSSFLHRRTFSVSLIVLHIYQWRPQDHASVLVTVPMISNPFRTCQISAPISVIDSTLLLQPERTALERTFPASDSFSLEFGQRAKPAASSAHTYVVISLLPSTLVSARHQRD
jgi:hypothetical protein